MALLKIANFWINLLAWGTSTIFQSGGTSTFLDHNRSLYIVCYASDPIKRVKKDMDQYYVSKIYKHIICSEVNDMFLWFPPPTKASWHNARESAEGGGTIL